MYREFPAFDVVENPVQSGWGVLLRLKRGYELGYVQRVGRKYCQICPLKNQECEGIKMGTGEIEVRGIGPMEERLGQSKCEILEK